MLSVFMCMFSLHHILLNEEIAIRDWCVVVLFLFFRDTELKCGRTKFLSLRFEVLSCASVFIFSHWHTVNNSLAVRLSPRQQLCPTYHLLQPPLSYPPN